MMELIEKRAFVLQTHLEPFDSEDIATAVMAAREEFRIDPALILAVIEIESRYEKKAKSKKGCKGLIQMSKWVGKSIAGRLNIENYNIFDIRTNIRMGGYFIRELLDSYKDVRKALTVYNKGIVKWLDNPHVSGYSYSVAKRFHLLKGLMRRENDLTCNK
jgi:soluble lytic murein transglycosylase-like protein